ncbi:MAG: cardiolipin synthase [Pseudomonadales bacterium]|nr:cardiolipin synthase [Pseudomonadales bacterium]
MIEAWLHTHLLILVYAAPTVAAVYHILLFKRDAQSALGWIMVCVFVPYVGAVVYFLFGINRVGVRARKLDRSLFSVAIESGSREERFAVVNSWNDDEGLRYIGQRISGHLLTSANKVVPFYSGSEAYSAMLESIENARHSVFLATYIFKNDTAGIAFINALERAAKRGLDVKVLLDGIGEYYSFQKVSVLLKARGVSVARFLPPRLFPPGLLVNLRNHRKLLIVDNNLAYAGGMNIGDNHTELASKRRSVTDMHFSFDGAIVDDLVQLFYYDWNFTTGDSCAPMQRNVVTSQGDMSCRLIPDGPSEELDALALTIQTVISAAAHSVYVMTPYFLPSRELIAALESAALRGVSVTVVLPQKNNMPIVHWANRNILFELLQAGVRVFYQPAPFCHSKLLCIDESYALIGSANLDPRSLRLNFELGVEIFSESFNRDLRNHFSRVVANSQELQLSALASRGVATRLRDSIAALFAPYL